MATDETDESAVSCNTQHQYSRIGRPFIARMCVCVCNRLKRK